MALEDLIESRRTLAARHAKLEAKLSDVGGNQAYAQSLKNEIANVVADMDFRSEKIVELKQKIADADLENKAKTRLDYLQTMVEAKASFLKVQVYFLLLTYLL